MEAAFQTWATATKPYFCHTLALLQYISSSQGHGSISPAITAGMMIILSTADIFFMQITTKPTWETTRCPVQDWTNTENPCVAEKGGGLFILNTTFFLNNKLTSATKKKKKKKKIDKKPKQTFHHLLFNTKIGLLLYFLVLHWKPMSLCLSLSRLRNCEIQSSVQIHLLFILLLLRQRANFTLKDWSRFSVMFWICPVLTPGGSVFDVQQWSLQLQIHCRPLRWIMNTLLYTILPSSHRMLSLPSFRWTFWLVLTP